MIALKVRQDDVTTTQHNHLGRCAELDYAESMMYSTAGLSHGTESTRSEEVKQDAYTMQLSAILAEQLMA